MARSKALTITNNKTISFSELTILVVDDDSASLAIASSVLKKLNYQVITIKNPEEASSIIRVTEEIKLVVSDLHMPQMSGIELQKRINEEFKLPVIIMSADHREDVIVSSLANGVAFYIRKPVNVDDLKNIWQYAIASRKGKSVMSEETDSIERVGSLNESVSHEDASALSVNKGKQSIKKKRNKRRIPKKRNEDLEEHVSSHKKAKIVWNTSLHDRFLQAIKHITLEKAVPKKILEFMNVPGLTRENVASHLQKYRIFLNKVAECGGLTPTHFHQRTLRSIFAVGYNSMMAEMNAQKQINTSYNHQPLTGVFGFGNNLSSLNSMNNYNLANHSTFRIGLSKMINGFNLCSNYLTGSNLIPTYQQQTNGGIALSQAASQPWKPSYNMIGTSKSPTWNNNFAFGNSNYSGINHANRNKVMDALNGGYGFVNNHGSNNQNMMNSGSVGLNNEGFGSFKVGASSGGTSAFGLNQVNSDLLLPSTFTLGTSEGANSSFGVPSLPEKLTPCCINNDGQPMNHHYSLFDNDNAHNYKDPKQMKECDLAQIVLEGTKVPIPNQAQGGDVFPNPNFTGSTSSSQSAVNPSNNQSMIPNFSSQHGDHQENAVFPEPSLEQLQEIEAFINQDINVDDYFPSSDQNPNQPQATTDQDNLMSELQVVLQLDKNDPSGTEGTNGWDEVDFMNSLFNEDQLMNGEDGQFMFGSHSGN